MTNLQRIKRNLFQLITLVLAATLIVYGITLIGAERKPPETAVWTAWDVGSTVADMLLLMLISYLAGQESVEEKKGA